MDRALNPKDEKQIIYEIYRACRLCGAGAGYRMPIIQSIVELDCDGVELRQKIRDCLQIEVNRTDRMPPLICELCVDKVNDFYEFFELCKQTNKRTRLRLGLPQQTLARDSPDSEKCILEVTEPVYVEDSDGETLAKKKSKKAKVKREPAEARMKTDSGVESPLGSRRSRESSAEPWRARVRRREPSPPRRATRQTVDLLQFEDTNEVPNLLKRTRAPEIKIDTPPPIKKVKLAPEPVKTPKPGPKSSKNREPAPNSRTKEPTPEKARKESTPVLKPVIKESQPGPKSRTKDMPGPKSKTHDIIGSKSRSHDVIGSKSRITDVQPGLNSKTKVLSNLRSSSLIDTKSTTNIKDIPGPKSKTHRDLPAPISSKDSMKSSKTDTYTSKSEGISSKTSKKDTKPSPPAKTKPKPKEIPKEVPKVVPLEVTKAQNHICFVCDTQCKTGAGLSNHMYKHSPSITSPKLACNPCELWFPSKDLADTHHRNHRNNNLPYKCTRCYGYFKLLENYDDHFAADLCLSVYEVPDVKCFECWLTFPTTKLMEEHRCAGEDGRPGGKCKKCNRSYALLKNQLKHESSCTYKKKGELVIEPEIQARLLPMEVRMSRCDTLLPTLSTAGQVDVSTLTQKFGLDITRNYPYLTVSVKTEPTTKTQHQMVTINDEVKQEYSGENTFKHFDSDSDSNSDISKPVDSLGAISLNILANKGIGNKRKKMKTELDDMSTKIDSIIDNLGDDTHNSFDSDSILDKNAAKNHVKGGNGTVGEVNKEIDIKTTKIGDDNVKDGKTSEVDEKMSCTDAVTCEKDAKTSKNGTEIDTNNKETCNVDKNDKGNAGLDENNDVTSSEITNESVKTGNDEEVKDSIRKDNAIDGGNDEKTDDVNNDNETVSDYKMDESRSLNDSPMVSEKDDSQTSCSVDSDNVLDKNIIIDKENDDTENSEVKTDEENLSESEKTDKFIKSTNSVHTPLEDAKVNDKDKKEDVNEEILNENRNVTARNDENEQINAYKHDVVEDSLAEDEIKNGEVVNKFEETGHLETGKNGNNSDNIMEKNNVDERFDQTEIKVPDLSNFDLNIQRSPNNEDLSKIDKITSKILQENDNSLSNHSEINENEGTTENESRSHEISPKIVSDDNLNDEISNIGDDQTSSNIKNHELPKTDNTSKNFTSKNEKNNITSPKLSTITDKISENSVNGVEIDKYSENNMSENDRKLMAELDAQIGENDTKQVKSHLIDDLLKKPDDLRSLDLDSISDDEFNFDV